MSIPSKLKEYIYTGLQEDNPNHYSEVYEYIHKTTNDPFVTTAVTKNLFKYQKHLLTEKKNLGVDTWELLFPGEAEEIMSESNTFVETIIEKINKLPQDPKCEIKSVTARGFSKYTHGTNRDNPIIRYTLQCDIKNSARKELMNDFLDTYPKLGFTAVEQTNGLAESSAGALVWTNPETNITYSFQFKGNIKGETTTNTDQKEGMVCLFYESDVNEPITSDNFSWAVHELFVALDTSTGIDEHTSGFLNEYLLNLEKSTKTLNQLNDFNSIAQEMKRAYNPGEWKIERTELYKQIRKAAEITVNMPADKWNPSDIYLIKDPTPIYSVIEQVNQDTQYEYIETINNLFVPEWTSTTASIVGISLKSERSLSGKGKSALKQYGTEYNLTSDEKLWQTDYYIENDILNQARNIVIDKVENATKVNITYRYDDNDGSNDELDFYRKKYAGLKIVNFMIDKEETEGGIFTNLASYGLGLTGVNPTFFKITGNKSGQAKVETFERGSGLDLTSNIVITDKSNYKGIILEYTVSTDNREIPITVELRSNGNYQVTAQVTTK